MHISLNVEETIDCVKNIVDSTRCVFCDKIDGSRVRCQCGHAKCQECVNEGTECLLCSPQDLSSKVVVDKPFTKRVKNASELLNACQDMLNVDVYKRKRISEQLKLEKEIFPECIQAPMKYTNKRKSSSISNKENISRLSVLSGKHISHVKTGMENSISYVQQWLENNESHKRQPRKPFTDLNKNNQRLEVKNKTHTSSRIESIFDKLNDKSPKPKRNLKTSLLYTTPDKQSDLKKSKSETNKCDTHLVNVLNNYSKDESGIVIDHETIVIDDSQSKIIDKDKLACDAVLNAEKAHVSLDASMPIVECTEIGNYTCDVEKSLLMNTQNLDRKATVPFYKKDYLTGYTTECKDCTLKKSDTKITIEKPNFFTITLIDKNEAIIKISNASEDFQSKNTHSVEVQTDINGIVTKASNDLVFNAEAESDIKNPEREDDHLEMTNSQIKSQDLFTCEAKDNHSIKSHLSIARKTSSIKNGFDQANLVATRNLVIEDSDSDHEHGVDILHVTANVHYSRHEIDILTEINQSEYVFRTNHKRAATPASSDSSNKENYDPNREKKLKYEKKNKRKKIF